MGRRRFRLFRLKFLRCRREDQPRLVGLVSKGYTSAATAASSASTSSTATARAATTATRTSTAAVTAAAPGSTAAWHTYGYRSAEARAETGADYWESAGAEGARNGPSRWRVITGKDLQGKENLGLGLHAADDRFDGNFSLAKASRNDQLNVVETGARQSHELRLHIHVVDVEIEAACDGRGPGELLSSGYKWLGGTEADAEQFDGIALLRGARRVA